jgi:uncharacterized membrane protein
MQSGTPERVRARRAPAQSIRSVKFRERVLESIWFLPLVMSSVALVVAIAAVVTDRTWLEVPPDWFPAADVGSATALTATVAAATLTFIATLFTTTLIAIQLASGQYSPRVVRIFIHSPFTHVMLGFFLAGFIVDVAALVAIRGGSRGFVPPITVGLAFALLLATLAAFVAYLHRMAQLLRVQYVMRTVVLKGAESLEESFPAADEYVAADAPEAADAPVTLLGGPTPVGVVQSIDCDALVRLAQVRSGWIELLVETGQYVGMGTPLARVHGVAPGLAADDLLDHFLLGPERTFVDDPGFALRLLADIAIRALSPAVNDPTTACQAVDRLVDLLSRVADRPDPTGWYVDEGGRVRLLAPEPGLDRLVALSFTEVIRYGADSPQVVRRLHGAFNTLRPLLQGAARAELDRQARSLDAATAQAMPAWLETTEAADARGLG